MFMVTISPFLDGKTMVQPPALLVFCIHFWCFIGPSGLRPWRPCFVPVAGRGVRGTDMGASMVE